MARSTNPKAYRLSFKSTRAKKWAPTKKEAIADARYWLSFGAMEVCIDRKLPSGGFARVKCMHRRKMRHRR